MNDANLNIWLRLKDDASKEIKGIQGRLKSFATTFKQNWVAITAATYGAILALRKAFQIAELGAQAKQIEDSFRRMAESVSIDAERMRSEIQEAADATVNFSNIAAAASALMAQGLNMDTIAKLMKQARAEARLFGKTTEESFQIIGSAITGGLVTTLRRSYGLQLSLEQAVKDYATANNLAEDAVRKNYMAQALANHILEAGKSHIKAVNLELKTEFEYLQEVKSRWLSFKEDVGQMMWKVVGIAQASGDVLMSGISQIVESAVAGLKGIVWAILKVGEGLEFLGSKIPGIGDKFKGLTDDVRETFENLEYKREEFVEAGKMFAESAFEGFRSLSESVKDGIVDTSAMYEEQAERQKEIAEEVKETLVDTEARKLEELKELWEAYQDERTAQQVAQYQREVEKYTFLIETQKKATESLWKTAGKLRDQFSKGVAGMFMDMINKTFDAKEAFKKLGLQMLQTIIEYVTQTIIANTVLKAIQLANTAAAIAQAGILASAWATPAYLASVATMGGAAVTGGAALTTGLATFQGLVTGMQSALSGIGGAVPGAQEGAFIKGSAQGSLVRVGENYTDEIISPVSKRKGFGDINIYIEHATFRTEEDAREVFEDIKYLLDEDRRGRI
ncbi:MAG: hypothetical protein JRI96_05450 [Deltaproteobacteria bacterium]|nr:hypothetical protein [Deltaproteobacteria bacterium]